MLSTITRESRDAEEGQVGKDLHAMLNPLYFILRVLGIIKKFMESNVAKQHQGIAANAFESQGFFLTDV